MSVLNQSGEEQVECPLCMEPLEVDDLHFYPCTCGYQICRFCWNRIREGENGRCPACRKAYPENPADFTPLSQEQVAAIKIEKRAREQKRRNKTLESRRALANVRVVQKNLVFVVGLPVRLADPEILKRQEYFGKYGKIHKVVINQSTTYAGSQGPSASAYVTYVAPADALRAIQGVNNVTLDGRVLKGSLGTTKYCANFMKNQPCPKPDCMYLHDLGDPDASFTKEEMHAGLHQAYERRLHEQLLAQTQREQAAAAAASATATSQSAASGNSSSNSEKSSTKEGTQSKFIPSTVITSSHISNIVNSTSKTKNKESNSGSGGSGNNSGSSSSNNNINSNVVGNSKEAWPSLGSSPPADTPHRKLPSPSQNTIKSQENGSSDSNHSQQQQSSQTKNKEQNHTDKTNSSRHNNKENNGMNHNSHRKNKQTAENKCRQQQHQHQQQQKQNNNSNENENDEKQMAQETVQHSSVFETDPQRSYLTNELDELESDRHSLLETHDLLENSDHSLLEDDNNHSLLDDANSEMLMMQRHREMLAGLVDSNHLMKPNGPVNGYALLDNNMYLGNDRQISQMYQNSIEKELMMRERNREMMMRQNELMARQALIDKHYMPHSSIGLDSASELLGANYHNNGSMMAPFGMRTMGGGVSGAGAGAYALQPRLMPQSQSPLVNGYDTNPQANGGRYLAENMDKFFTDFHKTQQMRLLLSRGGVGSAGAPAGMGAGGGLDARYDRPRNMLSAERLEMDHKQRAGYGAGASEASGDADDDLDFDPFKETQKALAEMIENESVRTLAPPPLVSGGDANLIRSRLPPPGFSHLSPTYGGGAAGGMSRPPHLAPHPAHHTPTHHNQRYSSGSAMYSDWTQMDPAIMSTSVSLAKAGGAPTGLDPRQQEVLARFGHLGMGGAGANGLTKPQQAPWGSKLGWSVPLPPGFAPSKSQQRPAECVDAN